MGSGASHLDCGDASQQQVVPPQASLSKEEIKELYEHLSCEYKKKVTELVEAAKRDKEAAEKNIEYVHDEDFTEDEAELSPRLTAEQEEDHAQSEGVSTPGSGVAKRKLYKGKDVHRKLMEIVIEDQPKLLHMKVKVNTKALGLLGDEGLDEGARKYVSNDTKITPKVLGRLGSAFIMPEKAVKRLGTSEMSREQRLAMIRAEEKEARDRADAKRMEMERILGQNPDDCPDLAAVRSDKRITSKAVEKLGGASDEKLMDQVRTQVTTDMYSKKTIQLIGDQKLLPKKVADRRGSEMKADQIQAMKRAEEKEARDRQKEAQEKLNEVLTKEITGSMMEVPDQVKGNPKLLEMAGETAFLPKKANKVLGDQMTPDQRRRMLDAERKEDSFNSQK